MPGGRRYSNGTRGLAGELTSQGTLPLIFQQPLGWSHSIFWRAAVKRLEDLLA